MTGPVAFNLFLSLYSLLFPQRPQATLLFAGDAMMHKGQLEASRRGKEYDYSECFKEIAPEISGADYAVVNLETTLGGSPYTGYPCFCTPDTFATALTTAGFDMFLQANNHTLDRRDRGLRRTINVLDSKGIPHIGTYANAAQRDSVIPCVKDINGFKISFLNYTYGTNGITVQGDVVVDYIDKKQIQADIAKSREAGAELVCVAIHWGDEYHLLPNASQRQMADFLVSEGVDMVIGGHPHVIQPMEMRTDTAGRKALVVYSLGNFISDMKKVDTRGGAMTKVWISRNADGKAQVDSAAYRLVFTEPGVAGQRAHKLVYPEKAASPWFSTAAAFAKSARAIFEKHNRDVNELPLP